MNALRNHRLRFFIILLVSAFLIGCSSKPEKTADHFMSLLVAGKHLEVQEMLAKDMKSMAGMLGGVSDQTLNPYYRSGSFQSYTLTEQERAEKSVRYTVRAVTSDSKVHKDFIDLIREDGEWKVSRF